MTILDIIAFALPIGLIVAVIARMLYKRWKAQMGY